MRLKLPETILGQVWILVHVNSGNSGLTLGEFCLAMRILNLYGSKAIASIPTSLPPLVSQSLKTDANTSMATLPSFGAGQDALKKVESTMDTSSAGMMWTIKPEERAQFDSFFDGLDINKAGFITGSDVVPFLKKSNLPDPVLSTIWMMADFDNSGKIDRNKFAIIMFLTRKKMSGATLPPQLPPSLLPSAQLLSASTPVFTSTSAKTPSSAFLHPPNTKSPFSAPLVSAPSSNSIITSVPSLFTGASSSNLSSTANAMPTGGTQSDAQLQRELNMKREEASHLKSQAAQLQGDIQEISKKKSALQEDLTKAQNEVNELQEKLRSIRLQRDTEVNSVREIQGQTTALQQKFRELTHKVEIEGKELDLIKARVVEGSAWLDKQRQVVAEVETRATTLAAEKQQLIDAFMKDKSEYEALDARLMTLNEQNRALEVEVEDLRQRRLTQRQLADAKKQEIAITMAREIQLSSQNLDERKGFEAEKNAMEELNAKAKIVPKANGHAKMDAFGDSFGDFSPSSASEPKKQAQKQSSDLFDVFGTVEPETKKSESAKPAAPSNNLDLLFAWDSVSVTSAKSEPGKTESKKETKSEDLFSVISSTGPPKATTVPSSPEKFQVDFSAFDPVQDAKKDKPAAAAKDLDDVFGISGGPVSEASPASAGEDPFAVAARSEGAESPEDPFSVVESSPKKDPEPSNLTKSTSFSIKSLSTASDKSEEDRKVVSDAPKSPAVQTTTTSPNNVKEFEAKFPSLDDFEGQFQSKQQTTTIDTKSQPSLSQKSPEAGSKSNATKAKSPFDDFDAEFSKMEPTSPVVVSNDADFEGPLKDFFKKDAPESQPVPVSDDPFSSSGFFAGAAAAATSADSDPFTSMPGKSKNASFVANFEDPFAAAGPVSPQPKEVKPEEFDAIFGGGSPTPAPEAVKSSSSVADPFGDPFGSSPSQPPAYTPASPTNNSTMFSDAFSSEFKDFTDMTGGDASSVKPTSPVPGIQRTSSIEEVIAMGFTEEQAIQALERYDHDIQKAINFLLDSSSGGEGSGSNDQSKNDSAGGAGDTQEKSDSVVRSGSKKLWNPFKKGGKSTKDASSQE